MSPHLPGLEQREASASTLEYIQGKIYDPLAHFLYLPASQIWNLESRFKKSQNRASQVAGG